MTDRLPPRANRAIKMFEGFHEYDWKKIEGFGRLQIPRTVFIAGRCKWVTYSSNKWNKGTYEYIHTIDSYPRVVVGLVHDDTGRTRAVPRSIRDNNQVLVRIGRALGYAFVDDGEEIETRTPRCEWFFSPSSRALFCIESKRKLLAIIWGGKLNVEDRGIVG